MATLLQLINPINRKQYLDKSHYKTIDEQREAVSQSCTLYVGNLSFYTTEEQLYEMFSKVGVVERIIMGLHRVEKTPCGFCFVCYKTRAAAVNAERLLNGVTMDARVIKVEMDPGFKEGRQFGRARSGGQVRDEVRLNYDAARGGYGALVDSGAATPGKSPAGAIGGPSAASPFAVGGPSAGRFPSSARRYNDNGNYGRQVHRDDYHSRHRYGDNRQRRYSDNYDYHSRKRRRRYSDDFENDRGGYTHDGKRSRVSEGWSRGDERRKGQSTVDEFGRDTTRRQSYNPRFRNYD